MSTILNLASRNSSKLTSFVSNNLYTNCTIYCVWVGFTGQLSALLPAVSTAELHRKRTCRKSGNQLHYLWLILQGKTNPRPLASRLLLLSNCARLGESPSAAVPKHSFLSSLTTPQIVVNHEPLQTTLLKIQPWQEQPTTLQKLLPRAIIA